MRKKEQSKPSAPSSRRFSLPKSHILRGRTNFKSLFANSKQFSSPSINFRFALSAQPETDLKMAFISPKKIGTAVKRNRAKRLLREAYRLNQPILTDGLEAVSFKLHGVFIARHAHLEFSEVQHEMVTLLQKLRTRIVELTPQ